MLSQYALGARTGSMFASCVASNNGNVDLARQGLCDPEREETFAANVND
jgi:hypothetical protein